MLKINNITWFLILAVGICHVLGSAVHPGFRGVARRAAEANSDDLTTNAARFKAGLGPLKPRNMYHPTRIQARKPQTSSVPKKKGYIQVRTPSGSNVGWVSKDHNSWNDDWYGTSNYNNRMSVEFTPANAPFNIEIDSSSTYPYLGFAGSDLTGSGGSTATLTDTNAVSQGSPATSVGNSLSPGTPKSESAIWFFDSADNRLTVQWVNPAPAQNVYTPKFWYISSSNKLVISRGTPSGATEVNLYFVD